MSNDSRTLATRAFEDIFSLILTGELPLGGVVNEVSLAQRFNISRGPVREAVQRLQGLRLVTREPFMRARVVELSGRDLVEIFQMRECVEGMACRLAAEAMPDREIRQLAQDLDQARKLGLGADDPAAIVFDVHVRIAQGCGNERIRSLLCEDLYHLLRIYRAKSGAIPGRRDQAFEEHWQIVRAMQARDADLAESLMRSHIARATQSLLAAMEHVDSSLKAAASA